MSDRPEELQVLVLKEWLGFMCDDSGSKPSPFDTKIVAENTLNHIAQLEAELKEAKADSKRLDKVFANGQSFRIYDRNGHMTVWSVDSREAIDRLEERP